MSAAVAAIAAKYHLTPAEVQYELAHLGETKAPSIMAAMGSFSTLATIAILLRILVRWRNKSGFKADDYTIFVAFILSWGSFVSFYYQTRLAGLGMHVLAITPTMIHNFTKAFYVNIAVYIWTTMFTQLSFLLLYKRVFTLYQSWFRNTLYGIGILSLSSNLACFLAGIFRCTPIKKGWDMMVPGHCINIQNLLVAHACITLTIDVSIVIAPMPLIWALQASAGYKAAVCGIFLLGSLVCIINVIKIHYFTIIPTGDATYKDPGASIWTHAQMCLGVVAACLVCLKPLVRMLHDVIFPQPPSSAATTTPHFRSTRNAKVSADSCKTLEGKDTGSNNDITFVPCQQSTTTPSFPGQSSSFQTKSTVESGPYPPKDVERGLTSSDIGVIREVGVPSLTRGE